MIYFGFHCHDKDLWSSLLCRLYRWSLVFFPPLFFFWKYSPLFVLYLSSVNVTVCNLTMAELTAYKQNADFIWKPIALTASIHFYYDKRECTDNLVTIRSSSALWCPVNLFLRNHSFQKFAFYLFCRSARGVQVELRKAWASKCVRPWGDVPPHDGLGLTGAPDCTRTRRLTQTWYMTIFFSIAPFLRFPVEIVWICARTLDFFILWRICRLQYCNSFL